MDDAPANDNPAPPPRAARLIGVIDVDGDVYAPYLRPLLIPLPDDYPNDPREA